MIRVWGGGIYEADSFYDICDGKRPTLYCCPWRYPTLTASFLLYRAWNSRVAGLHVRLWSSKLLSDAYT